MTGKRARAAEYDAAEEEDGDEGCELPEDKGEGLGPAEAKCLELFSVLLVTFGGIDIRFLHLWTVRDARNEYQASGIVRHFAAAL